MLQSGQGEDGEVSVGNYVGRSCAPFIPRGLLMHSIDVPSTYLTLSHECAWYLHFGSLRSSVVFQPRSPSRPRSRRLLFDRLQYFGKTNNNPLSM